MKEDFLDYYQENLQHLRELGGEFASQFPKVASRLDLSRLETTDPFVERLLEGTAFLAARVEQKFDDGYPKFIQSLLQRFSPFMLAPIPAVGVISLGKSVQSDNNLSVACGKAFKVNIPGQNREVSFSSVFSQDLLNGSLKDARFSLSLIDELDEGILKSGEFKSGLILDFNAALGKDFNKLSLFVNLPYESVSLLKEALQGNLAAVFLKSGDKTVLLDKSDVKTTLFDEEENIFAKVSGILSGPNLMQLYFAYPFLLNFLTVTNLNAAAETGNAGFSLIFALKKSFPLNKVISKDSFLLNTLAVCNLFHRRSDRVSLKNRHEYLVDVDRSENINYEIYRLNYLEIFDSNNKTAAIARPFYSFNQDLNAGDGTVFFDEVRRFRLKGMYKNRSSYRKTEVFVSLSGGAYKDSIEKLSEFSADLWCTNADLPFFISQDQIFKSGTDALEGRLVYKLTKPKNPIVMRGNMDDFTRLSYVLMNVQALFHQDEKVALNVVQHLIKAFSFDDQNEEQANFVQAVTKITVEKKVFRFVQRGCVYYENGYELSLILDEKKLTGIGEYAYGEIIIKMLRKFSPINLLITYKLYGLEKGLIRVWQ